MSDSAPAKTKDLILYQSKDGTFKLDVKLTDETVWLSQAEIATLFGVNVPAVSKHIKNIYADGELQQKGTVSKMETVRKEGKRTVTRQVDTFNLDLILSVGYRVNSSRATHFRVWATQVLRQHLIKGYTLNAPRLEGAKLTELKSAVALIRKAMEKRQLSADESAGLLKVITDYAATWSLLKQVEEAKVASPQKLRSSAYQLSHDEAQTIIRALKKHLLRQNAAGENFGHERGDAFRTILETLFAPRADMSVEKRAAELLYELVKKQPFEDGNKRIAAFLFIVYLTRTECLTGWKGERKFSDNALVALVLLIAESADEHHDLILRLIMNFVQG